MTGTLGFLTGLIVLVGAVGAAAGGGGVFYKPYGRSDADLIYNLLFCDDPQLFAGKDKPAGAVATVLSKEATDDQVRKVADDQSVESRVRALAYNRLRAANAAVPK